MRPTRRQLLASAGGAAALAACGSDKGRGRDPGSRRFSDAFTLAEVLQLERAVVAAYGDGLPLLKGGQLRLARTIAEQERAHVRALERGMRSIGFPPPLAKTREEHRRSFPRLADGADALRFAVDLEQRLVRLYMDFLPRLYEPRLRRLAAETVACEAEHLSLLLLERGRDPVPEAFVTGTS